MHEKKLNIKIKYIVYSIIIIISLIFHWFFVFVYCFDGCSTIVKDSLYLNPIVYVGLLVNFIVPATTINVLQLIVMTIIIGVIIAIIFFLLNKMKK